MSLDQTLRVLKWSRTSIRRQSSEDLTFSFAETLPQSLWYVNASGTNVLFYCQMSGQFLKYLLPLFIKLWQEITFNKVLNKQRGGRGGGLHFCTTLWLVILHIRVICFEHMATWKRCCDMWKVCGIFLKTIKGIIQHNLNVHQRLSQILQLHGLYWYMLNLLKVSEC